MGAVARFEGSFFGAWGYSSEAEARRAAISNCEKQHGKGNCSYSTISGSECWALARAVPDRGGWGQGIAVTTEDAVDLAMKHCTDGADECKKSFTFCADGSEQLRGGEVEQQLRFGFLTAHHSGEGGRCSARPPEAGSRHYRE